MKVIDPGHKYELQTIDGNESSVLTFVKREGKGYPGNVGHYSGTIIQEVLRACIDRLKYVDAQIPDNNNPIVIHDLRTALYHLEIRAANRHGKSMPFVDVTEIENLPVGQNGHLLVGAGTE